MGSLTNPTFLAPAAQPSRGRRGNRLDPRDYPALFRQCQAIRDRYEDDVPLNRADRKVVLQALRGHPKGKAKFGAGVDAVVVRRFPGGGRCFFVIRHDGTAVDFSLRKCFPGEVMVREPDARLRALMDDFDTQPVVRKFRSWLRSQRDTARSS